MKKRFAIIGAGASGLPAIKSCLEEEIEPVCFEKTEDIGGLWNWKENPTDGRSTVMKSTIINTSKETSFYSDFIVPREYPNYMHNTFVMKYFRQYAEQFGLTKYIKFRTKVVRLSQSEDFKNTGRWKVELRDLETGSTRVEEFDGVFVCTGHHADKKMPHFEGQEQFEGKLVHSHDYTHYEGYEGKRVVVVGIGNSGADVTIELSKISSQVYLSTRRGSWIVSRVSDRGFPFDIVIMTRFNDFLGKILPDRILNHMMESWIERRLDHSMYGLKPAHRFNQQHPTACDDLANRLIAGSVIVKPNIRRLHKRSVEFEDGTVVDNIDAIICCTGYLFGFPFVDHKSFEVKDNIVNFYKYIFPPDISPATIAIIGCFQPIGGLMPVSELQCRWAVKVLKGDLRLPSSEVMWEDIRGKREALSKRFVGSTRHTMEIDFVPYLDELAEQVGCRPNLFRLFLTDPKLAWRCFFGPCSPYQYRLEGPGSWPQARDAILTVYDRILFPLKTRETSSSKSDGNNVLLCFFVVTAILVLLLSVIVSRWFV